MADRDRSYLYLEATQGLCGQCLGTVPAKIVQKWESIFLIKICPTHGEETVLLEEDATFHHKKRLYDKPGTASPAENQVSKGCPQDCGLCPAHEQHTCIGLVEVTSACDLGCPVCYANAGFLEHVPLGDIEKAMDHYQRAESHQAEILQISGGEPTTHPEILAIIAMAKRKGFRYVMLNTNGLRIAAERDFARALAEFRGGFEVYLQFDGLSALTSKHLRGRDLVEVKKQAVQNLVDFAVPITLVCTVEHGVNDNELGGLFLYGLNTTGVRGINFQPRASFGRGSRNAGNLTISGVIHRLAEQTNSLLRVEDFIPLPCNVEGVALTYLYRRGKGFVPITRSARIREYLPLINNTFFFKLEDMLKETAGELLRGNFACDCFKFLSDFRHLVPVSFFTKSQAEKMAYVDENTFRVSITRFLDAATFHRRAAEKECVHIVTPDGKRYPFSAYNLIHRERIKQDNAFQTMGKDLAYGCT